MTSIDDLPEEILLKIFKHLKFYTLQKKCTLVSTKWLNWIRNCSKFSSEVRFNGFGIIANPYKVEVAKMEVRRIEYVLNRWPKVQSFEIAMNRFGYPS